MLDVQHDRENIIDEATVDTGDWFIFPVSLRILKSTVIMRLQEPEK